jgi:hypothetical protein
MIDKCQIRCATEHTRSLPCGGYCPITPRHTHACTSSSTSTSSTDIRDADVKDEEHKNENGDNDSKGEDEAEDEGGMILPDSSFAVRGLILAMRLRSSIEPALVTIVQFVNEVRMLGESKKLKLAQNYYPHYSSHSEDEPKKPCLSNQLYR